MASASVSALEYLELGVADLDAWQAYCEQVLGLAVSRDGDALTARMDEAPWRLRMLPTGEDDVRALGFRVADGDTLDEVAKRLTAEGVEVTADDAARDARGVERLLTCADPDGVPIELYVGDRIAGTTFDSPAGVGGFVTGEQGFGHAVLMVGDAGRSDAFYQRGLGLRLSDYIVIGSPEGPVTITFLHCNARHHTLAYVPAPAPKRLNHLMLQTTSIDDVGRALDRARAHDVAITASLGRHSNDRMFSFYMRTPSGFDVEYGCDGIEVDDASWQATTHHTTSLWGHQRHG